METKNGEGHSEGEEIKISDEEAEAEEEKASVGLIEEQKEQVYWKFGHVLRSTLPLLVIMAAVGTLSGILLQGFEEQLLTYPATLVLVPAIIGVGGNLGAVFSSRLSTAVHLGILEIKFSNIAFRNNVVAIVIASALLFLILGLAAFAFSAIVGVESPSFQTMLVISLASGGILMSVLVPLAVGVIYLSYKSRIDPDDVTIPVVTTIGDIVGVIALFTVVIVILL